MPADYEIGFKRPPKASQFKKGESANPRGRPKGTRNLKTDLAEELASRVTITVQGKRRTVSKQQAFVMATLANAMKGHAAAANLLFKMMHLLEPSTTAEEESPQLSVTDQQIIDEYFKGHFKSSPSTRLQKVQLKKGAKNGRTE
jgi:hypothetical protein